MPSIILGISLKLHTECGYTFGLACKLAAKQTVKVDYKACCICTCKGDACTVPQGPLHWGMCTCCLLCKQPTPGGMLPALAPRFQCMHSKVGRYTAPCYSGMPTNCDVILRKAPRATLRTQANKPLDLIYGNMESGVVRIAKFHLVSNFNLICRAK